MSRSMTSKEQFISSFKKSEKINEKHQKDEE